MLKMFDFQFFSLFLQFAAIFLFCYWLWTRRHLYAFCLRTPGFWGLPILGCFYKIQSADNVLPAVRKAFEDLNESTICVWLGLRPILLTKEPLFIEKLLKSHDIREIPAFVSELGSVLSGDGFLNSNGPKWQRNRKLLAPFFQNRNVLQLFPVFNDAKNTLIEKFAEMDSDNEHEVLGVIQDTFFGASLATILNQQPEGHLKEIRDYIKNTKRCKEDSKWKAILNFLKLSALHSWDKNALKFMKCFIRKRVNLNLDTKIELEPQNQTKPIPGNYLDFAMKLYQSKMLSLKEIVAESHTVYETSAETTQFSVYSALVLLAMHPEIQARLFAELKAVFVESPNEINAEHLKQLPYLSMVINEVLRLIPPVPLIPRSITKDTQLCSAWHLPKGLDVLISTFDLHYRQDIWGPDAQQFNPNHFSPESIAKVPPGAYIPFSRGARDCIGSQYALYVLKVTIAGLVRRFEFRTSSKLRNLRFTFTVATEFLEKPKLQIFKRKN